MFLKMGGGGTGHKCWWDGVAMPLRPAGYGPAYVITYASPTDDRNERFLLVSFP